LPWWLTMTTTQRRSAGPAAATLHPPPIDPCCYLPGIGSIVAANTTAFLM
jgi:hypothetical protein